MKITFLGTSHGVPAADRYCAGYMIESGNAVYLIDAGAPVADEVLRKGREITDVRAIFTTHIHGDHTAGIFHIADLVNWYYKEHTMDIYAPEQCFIDAMKNLILACAPGTALHEDRLRFCLIDPNVAYEDENIQVTFIPTKHMLPYHSNAILVQEKSSGKRILFGGDFSHKLKHADVPTIISEEALDAFVCEMAHFGAEEIRPYLENCKAKNVYFTHVFRLEKYDDIKALDGQVPCRIHTPNDGDIIEL